MTEALRKQQYPLTQAGYTKDKKKFVSHLEECSPVDVDESALAQLYAIAFGADDKKYDEYKLIDISSIPSSTLLQEAIVGRSDTAFAKFVRALNASGWLSQGHNAFQHEAGKKCPYCQQNLPSTFEADLASCFDEQYKQTVSELEQFVAAYRAALNAIHAILAENSKNPFTCDLNDDYSYIILLDEMVEMGILNQSESGIYRLRRNSFVDIIGENFDTLDAEIISCNEEA